jgi:hypothetical protein
MLAMSYNRQIFIDSWYISELACLRLTCGNAAQYSYFFKKKWLDSIQMLVCMSQNSPQKKALPHATSQVPARPRTSD